MMQAFKDIILQPSYGAQRTLVTWSVDESIANGDFFVLRSPDGAGDWQVLNEEPVQGIFTFEDKKFVIENRHAVPHYRVHCRHDGKDYHSPAVGLFDEMTRAQYGAVAKIMKDMYIRMSRGNGVKILHYIPKTIGVVADNFDPDTGQSVGDRSCPAKDPAKDGFGQKFQGGYRKPFLTWCEFVEVGPIAILDQQEGMGSVDEFATQARFMAYPRPKMGDLIVQPRTDNRYVVGKVVKGYFFRGVIPVAWDIKLELLRRSDPAYRVPVPFPLPDPLVPVPHL